MTFRARKNKGVTKPTKNAQEPISGRAGSDSRAEEILIMAIFELLIILIFSDQKNTNEPLGFPPIPPPLPQNLLLALPQGQIRAGSVRLRQHPRTRQLGPFAQLPAQMGRSTSSPTQGDLWSGSILLAGEAPETVEYKYIIADWHEPARAGIEWEVGAHNRRLDLAAPRTTTVCGTHRMI